MTQTAPRLDRRGRAAALQAERRRLWAQAEPEGDSWHAGASVLSGVLMLGGAGWLLQLWLGWSWLVPVGVVLGMAVGLTSLWFRYGVARPAEGDPHGTSDDAGPADRSGSPQRHRSRTDRPVTDRPTHRSPLEDPP